MRSDAVWGLVLAGGDGRRLQALTARVAGESMPKQYCRLLAGRSLLEATLDRMNLAIPAHRMAVIVNRDHARWAEPQIGNRGLGEVIVQPYNRDTGPGLLLSLLRIARRDAHAVVAVLPSDHWVGDDQAFMAHVMRAVSVLAADPERIVCLGVAPEHPDPGLGYVIPERPIPGTGAFTVRGFREKPGGGEAEALIRAGGLWNSFVMALRVDTALGILRRLRPRDVARMARAFDDRKALHRVYVRQPPWNFSHEVLATEVRRLAVLPMVGVEWSDWGTPEAIGRTLTAYGAPDHAPVTAVG